MGHAKGKTTVVVVHREELAQQAAERLRAQGLTVGVMMGGQVTDPSAPIQVAGVQTLYMRIKARTLQLDADLLFIDEAHHCVSPSWRIVLDHFRVAGAVALLFSATPWQVGGQGLGVGDVLVQGPTPQVLADAGVLVPPRIFCGPTPDLSSVRSSGGDFIASELASKTSGIVGDVVETWVTLAEGRPTICFAVNVAHSMLLVSRWASVGVRAAHVDGDTPSEQRRETFAGLRGGQLDVVCNVGVATEGFDAPSVSCISLARPTQSEILYLQQVGRGLRSFPGKTDCLVLDHGYNALRHGHPFMAREVSLEGRPPRKMPKEGSIVEDSPFFRLCRSCMVANVPDATVCVGCQKLLQRGSLPSEKKAKVKLVEFKDLDPDMRSELRIAERKAAWRGIQLESKNPWDASFRYQKRYGILPHHDQILTTAAERGRYWQARRRQDG